MINHLIRFLRWFWKRIDDAMNEEIFWAVKVSYVFLACDVCDTPWEQEKGRIS